MKIWTIIVVFLRYYCSVLTDGQLQSSLKGNSGGKTFQQNDATKRLSRLSLRHDLDGDQSRVVQQSFALISSDETRRLGTTEVKNCSYFFFRILFFYCCLMYSLLCDYQLCIFCVEYDLLLILFLFLFS